MNASLGPAEPSSAGADVVTVDDDMAALGEAVAQALPLRTGTSMSAMMLMFLRREQGCGCGGRELTPGARRCNLGDLQPFGASVPSFAPPVSFNRECRDRSDLPSWPDVVDAAVQQQRDVDNRGRLGMVANVE